MIKPYQARKHAKLLCFNPSRKSNGPPKRAVLLLIDNLNDPMSTRVY